MSQGDHKRISEREKASMLNELESLSRMLDEEEVEAEPGLPIPEDIPVLKSFVEDVPVLGSTAQPKAASSALDMSFLDQDPLEISPNIKQKRTPPAPPPEPSQSQASVTVKESGSHFSPSASENPFLPRATLDKIRENRAWKPSEDEASAELRKLLQDNPLQKLSFDSSITNKEYQSLRVKASQLVNEVIRASLPRLEAELRMKLEQEVDRIFKEHQKK